MFKLKNKNGIEISFIENGGKITGIKVPNASGEVADVVLGYDTEQEAIAGDAYFGALCGRFSNRIVEGKFKLDGVDFQLSCNDGKNHLHGGDEGFNARNWEVEAIRVEKFAQAYKLSLVSPDGDQNYPGELKVNVIYGLTEENEFVIEYEANTTKNTIINLTSHAYFNLKGAGNGSIESHELTLNAEKYTPLSGKLGTVDGSIAPVVGTPMDFSEAKKIGEAITDTQDEQIALVNGIDHNFIINEFDGSLKLAATLVEKNSGRKLEVYTDQPGIQVYTGSHFDGSDIGKGGLPMHKWAGVALETQIYPNSPNNDNFPNAVLKMGDTYKHTCIYKFSNL